MVQSRRSPDEILNQAIALRAEAFRRWRLAADAEAVARKRRIYEALAAFECDRYDNLVRRFLYRPGMPVTPLPAAAEIPPVQPPRSAGGSPSLSLPRGALGAKPLRAARIAAEAERRTWADRLRRTARQDPQHLLVTELLEEARQARDLIAPGR